MSAGDLLAKVRRRIWIEWWLLQTKRRIRREGWECVSTCDDDETFCWTYTVGFDETLGQPEIAICGLSPRRCRQILALVYRDLQRGALVLDDGVEWEVVGRPRGVWRKVHWTRLTPDWFAVSLHRRKERTGAWNGFAAYQLVLPDMSGVLPWEADYDPYRRRRSPELWLPDLNSMVAMDGGL